MWRAGGCDSSAGSNAEPRLRQRVMGCHHCVPQRAAHERAGATGRHGSAADTRIDSVLTCEEIFAEAHACTDSELYCRELCRTRPCCEPCCEASDPAQLRKAAKSARAEDRACEEALRVCFECCKQGSCAGVSVRMGDCPLQGCYPQGLAIRLARRLLCRVVRAGGQAFHGTPCLLKLSQRRVCLEPHCASEGQSLVRSPCQRCVGGGCRRLARSCRDVFAEPWQAHAAMPVRELHLHPLLICETCFTDDVAHAADQRVLNFA